MYFYTINHFPDEVSLTFIEAVAPPDEDEMDDEDSEDEEEEDANLDAANDKEGDNAQSRKRNRWTENTLLATVGEGMMLSTQARDQEALVVAHGTGEVLATAPGVFIESDVSNDDDIAVKVGADVLVMTRDHLIAAYADGNIRWINHTTAEFM